MEKDEIMNAILKPLQQDADAGYLILDIDGTLCDFQNDPELCQIRPEIKDSLRQLLRQPELALYLLTGRSYISAKALVADLDIGICSEHGLEHYAADGQCLRSYDSPATYQSLLAEVQLFQQQYPELRIEHKRHSVALHFREHPDLAQVVQSFVSAQLQQLRGYIKKKGNHVIEIAPRQSNKGECIQALVAEQEQPYVIYIGDDVTDEDAFKVVNQMRGLSIKVGAGQTAAHYRLQDIDQVSAVLQRYAQALKPASFGYSA